MKLLSTLLAVTGYYPVEISRAVARGKIYRNLVFQAFHLFAVQAAKVEMIVVMIFLLASGTNGEILLPIVGYNAMNDAIIAKSVQNTVDGGPVRLWGDAFLNHVMTERGISLAQGAEYGFFGGGVATFHGKVLVGSFDVPEPLRFRISVDFILKQHQS